MEEKNIWLSTIQTILNEGISELGCPFCKRGSMKIVDIPFLEESPEKGGERSMSCSNCDKHQVVLYRKPPENWMKLK